MAMSPRNWLLLLATAATFASSLPFNKVIVGEIGPVTLAFLRAITALPFLLIVLFAPGGRLPRSLAEARPALLAGLLLVAIPFAAIAWGQQHIASGLGGILYSAMPLFTILFAHFLVADEKLSAWKVAGAALGMAGVAMVIGPGILVGGLGRSIEGEIVTLVAPLSYALGTVYLRRHRHLHPIALMTIMFCAASLALAPVALLLETPFAIAPAAPTWAALAGLALVGTALPALLNYLFDPARERDERLADHVLHADLRRRLRGRAPRRELGGERLRRHGDDHPRQPPRHATAPPLRSAAQRLIPPRGRGFDASRTEAGPELRRATRIALRLPQARRPRSP